MDHRQGTAQCKTINKGIIHWVMTFFFHYQSDFTDKTTKTRTWQAGWSNFKKKKRLKHSLCLLFCVYFSEHWWALKPMLFILARELHVMHLVVNCSYFLCNIFNSYLWSWAAWKMFLRVLTEVVFTLQLWSQVWIFST